MLIDNEKDHVIRRVVEGGPLPRPVVVKEGGKSQLLNEIPILISKLRSLNRNLRVLAIIDQDDNPEKITESLTRLKK